MSKQENFSQSESAPEKEPFDLEKVKQLIIDYFQDEIKVMEDQAQKGEKKWGKDFGLPPVIERDKIILSLTENVVSKEQLSGVLTFLKVQSKNQSERLHDIVSGYEQISSTTKHSKETIEDNKHILDRLESIIGAIESLE